MPLPTTTRNLGAPRLAAVDVPKLNHDRTISLNRARDGAITSMGLWGSPKVLSRPRPQNLVRNDRFYRCKKFGDRRRLSEVLAGRASARQVSPRLAGTNPSAPLILS